MMMNVQYLDNSCQLSNRTKTYILINPQKKRRIGDRFWHKLPATSYKSRAEMRVTPSPAITNTSPQTHISIHHIAYMTFKELEIHVSRYKEVYEDAHYLKRSRNEAASDVDFTHWAPRNSRRSSITVRSPMRRVVSEGGTDAVRWRGTRCDALRSSPPPRRDERVPFCLQLRARLQRAARGASCGDEEKVSAE